MTAVAEVARSELAAPPCLTAPRGRVMNQEPASDAQAPRQAGLRVIVRR